MANSPQHSHTSHPPHRAVEYYCKHRVFNGTCAFTWLCSSMSVGEAAKLVARPPDGLLDNSSASDDESSAGSSQGEVALVYAHAACRMLAYERMRLHKASWCARVNVIYIHMYTCMYTCIRTHICMYSYTYTHIYIYVRARTEIHKYMNICN